MEKPKVLIDGIVFENPHQRGIWRVFYETLTRLKRRVDFTILVDRVPVNPVPDGIPVRRSAHRSKGRRSLDRLYRIRRRLAADRLANEYPTAIWHSTYFTCDPRHNRKAIVHVYDMVAEQFYHFSSALGDQCQLKAEAIRQADAAISISRSTTDELSRFFPEIRERIFTALLGADHIRIESPSAAPRKKSPLFVGHRDSYKNFVVVLRAMANPIWPSDVGLTVVGPPFSSHEWAHIDYFGLRTRIGHRGRLSDQELSEAYANASTLIFPSLEEGFGLPTLEAQSHGCVPLLSDISVFHEVSGEHAIFFNPYDPESLSLAVRRVDETDMTAMREGCVANAAKFTWANTADVVYQCYLTLK
jgi:glycosyltransferase involved in cell wall biosynthesis